ncbi:MAG: RNA polymerase sigma factor [Acidimicrobiales bacterium]
MSPSDDELVRRAQEGRRDALDLLLSRHYDRFYALCWRVMGNDADAADACQEALMAVVRGLRSFDNRSKFTTWSHRVVTNAAIDELRRRSRRPVLVDDIPEPSQSGASAIDQRVDALAIDDALAQLPEEFRAPVVLRDLYGLDYADIADTLGLAPGTVRSRISRGRRQLGALLGNQPSPTERQSARDD